MALETIMHFGQGTTWRVGWQSGDWGERLAFLLVICLYAGATYLLIKRSDLVAGIVCGREDASAILVVPDKDTVLQIAFMVIGVYLISSALSFLPGTLVMTLSSSFRISIWERLGGLSCPLFQLGIGVYLVLGAKGLQERIARLRRE